MSEYYIWYIQILSNKTIDYIDYRVLNCINSYDHKPLGKMCIGYQEMNHQCCQTQFSSPICHSPLSLTLYQFVSFI